MDTRKLTSRAIPTDVAGNIPVQQQVGQPDERHGSKQAGTVARSNQTDATNRAQDAAAGARLPGGDRGVGVSVSPRAREIAESHKKAFEIAKATPEIREDRVAELKRQIQAGTYTPDPARIADGIAREALLEYLSSPEGKDRI